MTNIKRPRTSPLSAREVQVLTLIGQGQSNLGIARTLQLSEHTVKSHLGRAMHHLRVRTRAAAVVEAARRGALGQMLVDLVQPDQISGTTLLLLDGVACDPAREETPIRTETGEWISRAEAIRRATALLSAARYARGGRP